MLSAAKSMNHEPKAIIRQKAKKGAPKANFSRAELKLDYSG